MHTPSFPFVNDNFLLLNIAKIRYWFNVENRLIELSVLEQFAKKYRILGMERVANEASLEIFKISKKRKINFRTIDGNKNTV